MSEMQHQESNIQIRRSEKSRRIVTLVAMRRRESTQSHRALLGKMCVGCDGPTRSTSCKCHALHWETAAILSGIQLLGKAGRSGICISVEVVGE